MESSADNRTRYVATYARVSTSHEAQLSAFDGQLQWLDNEIKRHQNWIIVQQYYDEGITGTSALKRPAFQQMLEDARSHKFDLIVTREVSRWSRNTVDSLSIVRELQEIGVEVYFVQDNIWTLSKDGELRLSLMSTLAQEESRKISERVLAGQAVSRENHTLYGNGNILGYSRVDGTYIIDEEQANTVRMIYHLYTEEGYGYRKIANELTRLSYKNASGIVKWDDSIIGRVLRNKTYAGYLPYNKSHCVSYLTQRRATHGEEIHQYEKGEFPAIITEEQWIKASEIRNRRSAHCLDKEGKLKKFGRYNPRSIWSDRLICSCGSSFQHLKWRTNKDGRKVYGYECYRKKRSINASLLIQHGLNPATICQTKAIPEWHIDLMARSVFRLVWKDQSESILLACKLIEECFTDAKKDISNISALHEENIRKLNKNLEGLRRIYALGDITREEYLFDSKAIKGEILALETQLEHERDLLSSQSMKDTIDLEEIKCTLSQIVDFSSAKIDEGLIDQFILQVIVVDDNTFNFTLNLSPSYNNKFPIPPRPSSSQQHRLRKRKDSNVDTKFLSHVSDPKEIYRFTVTADDAEEYCKEIKINFFRSRWTDKTVIISV